MNIALTRQASEIDANIFNARDSKIESDGFQTASVRTLARARYNRKKITNAMEDSQFFYEHRHWTAEVGL